MEVLIKTKGEVDDRIKDMPFFTKLNYLESCIKADIGLEMKKYCHLKMAEILEDRKMYADAAKNMASAGDIAIRYSEKIHNCIKEAELYIKAMQLDKAEKALNKALSQGNIEEKKEMKEAIKEFYMKQANAFEKTQKNRHAMEIYEKLIRIGWISEAEREVIKEKLIELYEKLGKHHEARILKGV